MTITWINTAGGAWSAGANWSTGTVPAAGDDVLINGASAFTITSSANQSAASVTLNDPSATLALNSGTLQLSGSIALGQGTFALGRQALLSAQTLVNNGGLATYTGGTVSVTTWKGLLDLSADNQSLNMAPGFTVTALNGSLPGTINLTGISSTLNIIGPETIDNVKLNLGAAGSPAILSASSIQPLIGSQVLLVGKPLTLGAAAQIDVTLNGDIEAASITNKGSITIENGASLLVSSGPGGTFISTGSITISPFGTLDLDSFSTLSGLGAISGGGLLQIGTTSGSNALTGNGTLDLGGGTITTGPAGAFHNFRVDGTLQNGTVIQNGGTNLIDGVLSNLTWLGQFDMHSAQPQGQMQINDVNFRGLDGTSQGLVNIGVNIFNGRFNYPAHNGVRLDESNLLANQGVADEEVSSDNA